MAVLQQDKHETSIALREVLQEVADLKHTLNNLQVEMQILDEQFRIQESILKTKTQTSHDKKTKGEDLSFLDNRIASLEQKQNKMSAYASKIEELEFSLNEQKKLLQDISQLKSTLSVLEKTLYQEQTEVLYQVKAGDSLEKIARLHKTSVNAIKQANNLSKNTIMIGEELKIPSGDS